MKIKNNILIIFIMCILTIFLGCEKKEGKIPDKPTEEIYFQDYAKMFEENTKEYVLENSEKLFQETTADLTIVTVNSLGNKSIEEYSNELFREWGIGDKEKNNGVLILIAIKDKEFRIEVGYGLEGKLSDGKCGEYLRELKTYFQQEKYDEGIIDIYSKLEKGIRKEEPLIDSYNSYNSYKTSNVFLNAIIYFILIYFVIIFVIVIIYREKKLRKNNQLEKHEEYKKNKENKEKDNEENDNGFHSTKKSSSSIKRHKSSSKSSSNSNSKTKNNRRGGSSGGGGASGKW